MIFLEHILLRKFPDFSLKYMALSKPVSESDFPLLPKIPKDKFFRLIEGFKFEYVIKDKIVISTSWADPEEVAINNVTDPFTGLARAKAKFANFESPFDFWEKNKHSLSEKILNESNYEIREILYNMKGYRMCNNFRITVSITILNYVMDKYNIENPCILDPSAGWGDRLMAAISLNLSYTGIDPNPALKDGFLSLIETYGSSDKHIFINDCFLKASYSSEMGSYDIVFTSPPFFDFEKYSDDPNQSIVQYPEGKVWLENFLIPYLKNAISLLKKDGILILYLNDVYNFKFMRKVDEYLCKIVHKEPSIYFKEKELREVRIYKKI